MPPTTSRQHLRSLYRRLLRELPSRPAPATLLSAPSPLHQRLRASFVSADGAPNPAAAEQFAQYVQAQRMYVTLLERYNPGMQHMGEDERVRLTARRVGMDLPLEAAEAGRKA